MVDDQLSLSKIGQIAITVESTDGSLPFYRDVLGMKFLFRAGPLAFFNCDGVRLMLTEPERPGPGGNSVVYFTVADLQGAVRTLESHGVRFVSAPHIIHSTDTYDLWMAFSAIQATTCWP